jgi:hypothetical protein
MTIECSAFVAIPETVAHHVLELERHARAALRRAEKAVVGDRGEALRFESLHAAIDQIAAAAMSNGEPTVLSDGPVQTFPEGAAVLHDITTNYADVPREVMKWLAAGRVVVALRLPHRSGETDMGREIGRGPRPPEATWTASVRDTATAARERFEFLLRTALDSPNGDRGAIRPSDVSNTALTEGLRAHVTGKRNQKRVDLRVVYRDGSEGPRFPMHALNMAATRPEGFRELRFTLMSVRHVDMDSVVDGAWLRNSKVSRPRPAGLTDEMVFTTSRKQLRSLDRSMPTLLFIYQTGLEPAIVGFYRAVVHHLLEFPRSIAVVPCYYQGDHSFAEGTPWRVA